MFTFHVVYVGEHEFRRKSMYNATKRRRTENTPRSNRLFGRNQVNRIKYYLFIFIARDCSGSH